MKTTKLIKLYYGAIIAARQGKDNAKKLSKLYRKLTKKSLKHKRTQAVQ